jgi:hypothetical protein
MNRTITIALIASLLLSGILFTESTNAQSITKPLVPEATAKLVDQSYDTPATAPTYTTDPYNGQQKQVTSGTPSYHVEKKNIEITIRNQLFTPYNDSAGRYIGIYYNLRFKGHYGSDWAYDPFTPEDESSKSYGGWDMTYLIPYTPSDSQYTTISLPLGTSGIANYGVIDLQVQAQIGYIQAEGNSLIARIYGIRYNFTGQSSDWSTTQTITIDDSATSYSTSAPTQIQTIPTPTSTLPAGIPQLSWEQIALAVMAIVVAALAAALVLSWRKRQ